MSGLIPVIDLFAGPGGLGEGFASCHSLADDPEQYFLPVLSIEKDPQARQTLFIRSFFRQFRHNAAPDCYYSFIRGEIDLEEYLNQATEGTENSEKAQGL